MINQDTPRFGGWLFIARNTLATKDLFAKRLTRLLHGTQALTTTKIQPTQIVKMLILSSQIKTSTI